MRAITNNAVAICCVIGAGVIAYSGNDGWGWFLFSGMILTSYGYKD